MRNNHNHTTWVEISQNSVIQNIQNFRKIISPNTLFAAILKSNAYGHGILEMANISVQAGANVIGINSLEEKVLLRTYYPDIPILLMGEVFNKKEYSKELADPNLWIVVSRLEDIQFLSSLSPRPKIHLKVDTGMSRLGFSGQTMYSLLDNCQSAKLPIDGILTHFASTEDFTEHSFSMTQLVRLQKFISYAESLGYKNLIKHAASSASTMLFSEAHLNMVRVGISLYGLWPSMQTRLSLSLQGRNFELHPVLSWKTRVVHLQSVPAGTFVGYGSTFKTNYPSRIAVIPVGYYEGMDRKLSNQSYVLIRGERAQIVGRVCMNMCMIDVTHIPQANVGEEVVLIGKSQSEEISADLLANIIGTINYDIVTGINANIPRIVIE